MMQLRREMIAETGPGWAVTDYDNQPLPGRWETKEAATENGYLGVYLLSGVDVVHVAADGSVDIPADDDDSEDADEPEEPPSCSICDGIGHGYPGGQPCPMEVNEHQRWETDEEERMALSLGHPSMTEVY